MAAKFRGRVKIAYKLKKKMNMLDLNVEHISNDMLKKHRDE